MSWDFRNANFHGSAVGPGARVYNQGSVDTVADLRAELDALRAELRATAVDDDAREDALTVLDALDSAVAEPEPDRGTVARRWAKLRTALAVALPTAANLAQIASLVNDLVGA